MDYKSLLVKKMGQLMAIAFPAQSMFDIRMATLEMRLRSLDQKKSLRMK